MKTETDPQKPASKQASPKDPKIGVVIVFFLLFSLGMGALGMFGAHMAGAHQGDPFGQADLRLGLKIAGCLLGVFTLIGLSMLALGRLIGKEGEEILSGMAARVVVFIGNVIVIGVAIFIYWWFKSH